MLLPQSRPCALPSEGIGDVQEGLLRRKKTEYFRIGAFPENRWLRIIKNEVILSTAGVSSDPE